MPRQTPRQRRVMGRVMHEFEHGELKGGRGGKVKSRRQAIAIGLHEAGASKYEAITNGARASPKPSAKRRVARHISRKLKGHHTSAPEAIVKAAPQWAVRTRGIGRRRENAPHERAREKAR